MISGKKLNHHPGLLLTFKKILCTNYLCPALQLRTYISSTSFKACTMARSTSALPLTWKRGFSNITVVQSCNTGYAPRAVTALKTILYPQPADLVGHTIIPIPCGVRPAFFRRLGCHGGITSCLALRMGVGPARRSRNCWRACRAGKNCIPSPDRRIGAGSRRPAIGSAHTQNHYSGHRIKRADCPAETLRPRDTQQCLDQGSSPLSRLGHAG